LKVRTRLVAAFVLVGATSIYLLVDWTIDDLRPRALAAMEETMVDAATVLASLVESRLEEEGLAGGDLREAFERARERVLSARIYEHTKTRLNLRVYITDADGIVVYDSDDGRDEGRDYSRWNDVLRTLRGEYGARSTRGDRDDPMTSVLYVASPVRVDGAIVGVLSVGKPAASVATFLKMARLRIMLGGVLAISAVVALGVAVSFWVSRPVERLTRYARSVRHGERTVFPRLGKGELGELGHAFEEMRIALEGKDYVENYVQTLTHQMKTPVSAIRGAAELLEEDMPPDQRTRFLANIRTETARIQNLIDRMLELASLENRRALRDVEAVDLASLVALILEELRPSFADRGLRVNGPGAGSFSVRGERFLLRQAITNLLQNAIDFSPSEGSITLSLSREAGTVTLTVRDEGPGIPEYALPKVFDRFYSLPRPNHGPKSSGLGLPFVREVAHLHGGRVDLVNLPGGGCGATLILPDNPPAPNA